jgi:hypothetical protein
MLGNREKCEVEVGCNAKISKSVGAKRVEILILGSISGTT